MLENIALTVAHVHGLGASIRRPWLASLALQGLCANGRLGVGVVFCSRIWVLLTVAHMPVHVHGLRGPVGDIS